MAGFGTAAAQLTIDGAQLLVHENCSDCLDDPEVLDTDNEQTWSQDVTDVSDFSQAGDEMGFALAAGDFNADGLTDLAVRRHLVLVFDGALRHGGFVVGNPTSRKK
jgi:hypothetical protein